MTNLFSDIEEKLLSKEEIIFNQNQIKKEIERLIKNKVDLNKPGTHFVFEEIIYDFFKYINIPLIKTKKTRDSGIDGIIKLKVNLLGEINVGLQIKQKIIDSTDIDSFIAALKLAELQLGTIVCKDSRQLQKYDLNSKIKTILLSRGIVPKENLIKDKIDINPVSIIKFDDILDIVSQEIRSIAKSIYKR